jgi:hypothetical protein
MEVLALKRTTTHDLLGEITEYLIANGHSMGRWTSHFGVHCLADTFDTKEYLKLQHENDPDHTEIEKYHIKKMEV